MALFPSVVYFLCMATSFFCMILLARSYLASRVRLLLWATLCFVGLTINNLTLFLDFVVFPNVDLLPLRHLSVLAGLFILLYGFIWDSDG